MPSQLMGDWNRVLRMTKCGTGRHLALSLLSVSGVRVVFVLHRGFGRVDTRMITDRLHQ